MDAITEVLTASEPNDLFGDLTDDALKKRYRKLAKQVHPDRFGDAHKPRAHDAFAKLQQLWDELHGKTVHPTTSAFTVSTKRHTYVLGDKLPGKGMGYNSELYSAEYRVGDDAKFAWLRFAREPLNNDAILNEIKILKRLNKEVPEEHRIFHPKLIDAFKHRETTSRIERQVSVIEALDGYISLVRVHNAYEWGLDPRDMAWMLRRLLVALGTAHDAGIALNAKNLMISHTLIRPHDHGLVVVAWDNAQELTEELRKKDLHKTAQSMLYMIDPYKHKQIATFLRGMQLEKLPPARELLAEFDELLERLYGPRKFRVFEMPEVTTEGK